MNLYLLFQNENDRYDTYDSCVVIAESEELAKLIHPNGDKWNGEWEQFGNYSWAHPDNVKVKLLGTSVDSKEQVVLASFNAG